LGLVRVNAAEIDEQGATGEVGFKRQPISTSFNRDTDKITGVRRNLSIRECSSNITER
jgi:hypothetical protein